MELIVLFAVAMLVLLAVPFLFRPKPDLEPLKKELLEALRSQRQDLRSDAETQLAPLRQQLSGLAKDLEGLKGHQAEAFAARFKELDASIQQALREARLEQGARLDQVQERVEQRLQSLQKGNDEKLEQMRQTVDEKLHATLEQRLGESFKQVSERLEQVQRSFGEMKAMADDVGGLKRALTNVKTRGVLGEAQLGALLEQYLERGQYETNVKVRPRSSEQVEFAVRLPDGPEGGSLWLPIDAKFPIEDYQRLMDAYDAGLPDEVARHARALEDRIASQARDIRDKYIAPPHTTDFAILFLPFEGLYAEALRRPGLLQRLQRDCKVTLAGPTTLTAFLNSLQMGFRTLKVSRNTAEIAKVLGAVKTDFLKFGEALEAVDKKLDEAKTKLGAAADRRRILQDKLRKVEALPETEAQAMLGTGDPSEA